jgi:hypothetical protein
LTFTITVKDLSNLTNSGAAKFTLDTLSTKSLTIDLSGAGEVVVGKLTAESVSGSISGLGGIEMTGEVSSATFDISGAGSIKASDLKIKTATITISGIGGADLWVTDRLTGEISGGGSVSYYGNPQTDTERSGIGNFKPLGAK